MAGRWYCKLLLGVLLMVVSLPAQAANTREPGIRIAARQSLVVTVPAGVQQVTSDDNRIAQGVLIATGDPQKSQVLIHGCAPGNTRLILWSGDSGQPMPVTVSAPQDQAPPSALVLNVNSFRIIRVPGALRRVAIGDESVAGVMVMPAEKPEDRTVSLLIDGRSPGITNLLIWTARGVDSLKVAVR